jgi:putative membrane protein
MNKSAKQALRLYVTGFTMGTADLIPGVSGGTVAFVSGIYEELLTTIKTVTGTTLKLLLRLQIREAIRSVPWRFALPLGLGLASALFSLAQALTYLLANHPTLLWAFFFGLVGASTYVVAKRVVKWDWQDYIAFILAAIGAYVLVGEGTVHIGHSPLITFISGAIAICAMILPGISGSFILVLLGQYHYVLQSVVERDLPTLALFTLGTLVGISIFSRFLSWLFKKHHDISVAALSGFMLGSLRKIWPFPHNDPASFSNARVWLLLVLGVALVLILTRYHALKEQTGDLSSQSFKREHAQALKEQK